MPCPHEPTSIEGSERCPVWVASSGPISSPAWATDITVDTSGERVYVTGNTAGTDPDAQEPQPLREAGMMTVAYDTVTGLQLWSARHAGKGEATAISASQDGRLVFVTGGLHRDRRQGYVTIAYESASGSQIWSSRFLFRPGYGYTPKDLVAGPRGKRLYVIGDSRGSNDPRDYLAIAYDTASGRELWLSQVSPGGGQETAWAAAVDPFDHRLVLTGWGDGPRGSLAGYTVAFNARTGEQQWAARDGPRTQMADVTFSPDGKAVYVAGGYYGAPGSSYVTAGYAADSGQKLWDARFQGPVQLLVQDHIGLNGADAIAVSPQGDTVYVTGTNFDSTRRDADVVTIAYSAGGGKRLWASRHGAPRSISEFGADVAVSPDGSRVYVSGPSLYEDRPAWGGTRVRGDYLTLAYEARTGRELWSDRHNSQPLSTAVDIQFDMALDPSGDALYVTGAFDAFDDWRSRFGTLAYDTTL